MSKLPGLVEYNGVVQNPKTAFTDPILQTGSVSRNNLGLPESASGGFALTYELTQGSRRYAVRVFHKHSPDLQKRYIAISQALSAIRSPYLVDFQFQNAGVRVDGGLYPLVKMDWIDGETLGNFLVSNFRNKSVIENIRREIIRAAMMLEQHQIAHGDLQIGNIMVAGQNVRLIDYDGMFVQSLSNMRSSEKGNANFQHPGRNDSHYNQHLDRFSLIVLDLSLEIIAHAPHLYEKYGTSPDNILFTETDFVAPEASDLFAKLLNHGTFRPKAERLAALCKTDFLKIPSHEDFSSGKWVPAISITSTQGQTSAPGYKEVVQDVFYQGNVLDASNFEKALTRIGDRVEMVGQVTEVKEITSKYGKSYLIFLNFGDWRGKILKASVRGPKTQKLRDSINASWAGQWLSITGMVEPVYSNPRYKYHHISITVSESIQIHKLTAEEAQFRLGKPKRIRTMVANVSKAATTSKPDNRSLLEEIQNGTAAVPTPLVRKPTPTPATSPPAPTPPRSRNQQLLDQLNQSSSSVPQGVTPTKAPQSNPQVSTPQTSRTPSQATSPTTGASKPAPAKTSSGNGCGSLIVVLIVVAHVLVIAFANRK